MSTECQLCAGRDSVCRTHCLMKLSPCPGGHWQVFESHNATSPLKTVKCHLAPSGVRLCPRALNCANIDL